MITVTGHFRWVGCSCVCALIASGCGPAALPQKLVSINELVKEGAWAARAQEVAPDAFAELQKQRKLAVSACADEEPQCEHYTAMADIQLKITEEHVKLAAARQRASQAEKRRKQADKVYSTNAALKSDYDARIERMQRIKKLNAQLQNTKSSAQATKVRLQLEKAKREAELQRKQAQLSQAQATAAATQEQLDVFLKRGKVFEKAMAIVGKENVTQTFRGIVLAVRGLFPPGKTKMLDEKAPIIKRIAVLAKEYPAYQLVVEGYTDSRGRQASNLALSQGRAQAVLDALVTEAIPTGRIRAAGYGKERPVSDNKTKEGRAKNRRVEIVFLFASK